MREQKRICEATIIRADGVVLVYFNQDFLTNTTPALRATPPDSGINLLGGHRLSPLLERRGGCAPEEIIAKQPLSAQPGWLFKFEENSRTTTPSAPCRCFATFS